MSAVDREQLIDGLTRCVRDRPEILEAYIFGSHARGQAQAHSDLDAAVYVEPARLSEGLFGYQAKLTTALATELGNDAVDVVILNRAPPLLYHRVLRDGVRIVAYDLAATTTREARALSRYCDFLPHLRKVDAAHRHRIERGDVGR
jgi:predicted nucleotidyltransferase